MSVLEYKNIKLTIDRSISGNHFNSFAKVINYLNDSQCECVKRTGRDQYNAINKLVGYLSDSLKSPSKTVIEKITDTIISSAS